MKSQIYKMEAEKQKINKSISERKGRNSGDQIKRGEEEEGREQRVENGREGKGGRKGRQAERQEKKTDRKKQKMGKK